MDYPKGWPECPVCGKPAMDGRATCGELSCTETYATRRRFFEGARVVIDGEAIPAEFAQEATGSAGLPQQQLVARIKRSSKYYGQTPPNQWFDVRVVEDRSYHLRGNNNNYRLGDVTLGMRLRSGAVVDLGNGKITAAAKDSRR